MKIFKKFIDFIFSQKALTLAIFLCTAVLMTAILSSKYYLFHNIIENSISKRDIYANKTIKVEDVEKTQRKKAEIAKKVAPILVPVQDGFVTKNLDKNLDRIIEERLSSKTFDEMMDEMVAYFNIQSHKSADLSSIEFLLKLDAHSFDRLDKIARKTLQTILKNGVEENDIENNFDKILDNSIAERVSNREVQALNFLIRTIISPNIVVDEEATEMSRKNAMNSVKPEMVVFNKGDIIVHQDQLVSKVQKDALKKCGYNVIQLNMSGILGIFLLVSLSLFFLWYNISNFETRYAKNTYYSLLLVSMLVMSAVAVLLPTSYWVYLLPVPAFTILLSVFINPRLAAIASMVTLAVISISFQYDVIIPTIFIFGIWATMFAMGSIDYTQRFDLIRVGVINSVVYSLILIGMFFLEYNLHELNFTTFGQYFVALFANGIISSVIALGLLPIIEVVFKLTTPYGLMELSNTNQPLLKKLQLEAPGTYHHSLMVANLAEAAAEAVGANPTLVRIGALYHDVGKLKRPLFFIENQSYFGIENPHEKFTPRFSKMVITTHPRDGVEIAKEYNISPVIYPFILEHHGDSIASYFYNQAIQEEGKENVDESQFRYNAPKPHSKETAILMLADAVESAVRSLKSPTIEEVEAMINNIVQSRLADGQFSASPITLKDLKTITSTFLRLIKGMQHSRIQYHEQILDEMEEKTRQLREKAEKNENNKE